MKFIEDNDAILPDGDSEFADEGTRAHALADAMLSMVYRTKRVPTPFPKADNPEMSRHVVDYTRWVQAAVLPGDLVYTERRVSLFYLPSQCGTVDVTIYGNGRLIIKDLKYGAGVSVDAIENKQLISYAESVARMLELVEDLSPDMPVTMEIYQPRDRNNSEPVRSWTITRQELATFAYAIDHQAERILLGEADEFYPTAKGCRFCRAKGICTAYATQGLEVLSDEPVDVVLAQPALELRPVKSLTREQRNKVLQFKKDIVAWLEAVEDQEVSELMNNEPPLDFKLVEGKSNRWWINEEKAAKFLRRYLEDTQIVPPGELISPAKAYEFFKDKGVDPMVIDLLDGHVFKPEGKPTLVPVEDKRQALSFDPASTLQDLDAGQDLI